MNEQKCYQKLKDDPSITRLYNILRKYSMDELLQLWNALKREMSLVGPRPFFPEQLEKYGEAYKHYNRVLPGITGLWHVTEINESEFDRRGHIRGPRCGVAPRASGNLRVGEPQGFRLPVDGAIP